MRKIFICGLGGGVDIGNSIPFYLLMRDVYDEVVLGSIRPTRLSDFSPLETSKYKQITRVHADTIIAAKGRYAEPRIADALENVPVYILSRRDTAGKYNSTSLREEFDMFVAEQEFDLCVFVDGGGDSLIINESDACKGSQSSNPFSGGDAFALKMLHGFKGGELYVVVPGIDIDYDKFIDNCEFIRVHYNGYFGSTDISKTGVMRHARHEYNGIMQSFLKLSGTDEGKIASKTATTLFHAINRNFGVQRTFVDWEGEVDGRKGVLVNEEKTFMHRFDVGLIHQIKLDSHPYICGKCIHWENDFCKLHTKANVWDTNEACLGFE